MKQICAFIFILMLAVPVRAEKQLNLVMTSAPPIFRSAEVLKVAYAKIGIQLNITQLPAKRAMEELLTGTIDGDVARIEGLDTHNSQIIQIKVPVNTIEGIALTCNNAIRIQKKEDLKGRRVGIHTGIRFAEELTKGMNPTRAKSWHKLFELLYAERIDVVIAFRGVEEGQVLNSKSQCLHINEPPLDTHNVYHYLNKRHLDIVPVITLILQEMQDSGEMAEILARPVEIIRPGQALPYGATPP